MDKSSLDDLIRIVQVVIIPLLGWVGWILRDIRDQLRLLNGRMIKQETWAQMHDRIDGEHHETVRREIDAMWHRVDSALPRARTDRS